MRIVLTNVGKEEITMDNNDNNNQNNQVNNMLLLNKDNNMPEINSSFNNIFNSKKLLRFIPKSKSSNKYKYNALYTENDENNLYNNNKNKNKLVKTRFLSINKNYIPNNYKVPFNGFSKISNKKSDLPLKLISLNNSVFTLPVEAKELYTKEELDNKNQLNKINLKTNKNKNDDSSFINKNLSLPKINIKNGLSLKNILNYKNKKNLDHNLLKKEINKTDTNLINYLKLDKCIQPSFVKKVNNANDERLFKLDKICQKYFQNEKEGIILKNNIQNKIKKEFSKDAIYCENGLKDMNNALKGIEHIYKGFQDKIDYMRDYKINYLKEMKNNNFYKK